MKNGIYIGKDSELGLTDSAAILFFRDPQHAWLESRLKEKDSSFVSAYAGQCRR